MALTLTELNAVNNDLLLDKQPANIVFMEDPILYCLMSGSKFKNSSVQPKDWNDQIVGPGDIETISGAPYIRILLQYALANSGDWGVGKAITLSKKATINAARFPMGGAYGSQAIDLNDQECTANPESFIKLVDQKLDEIGMALRYKLAYGGIWNAYFAESSWDQKIIGLANLFYNTSSATYGLIAEDDMSTWLANNDSYSGGNYAYAQYGTFIHLMSTAKVGNTVAGMPNLIVTTDTIRDGLKTSLQTQQRIQDGDMFNAGFPNVTVDGVPVVSSQYQASTYADALNLRTLHFMTNKDFAFTKPEWKQDPKEPDKSFAYSLWRGQFCCSNRKANARAYNITPAS